MYKVKGTAGGKAFKLDAKADLLHEAAVELQQKLQRAGVDADIEYVSFRARGAAEPELLLSDAVKRERKPKENGSAKRGARKKTAKRSAASE